MDVEAQSKKEEKSSHWVRIWIWMEQIVRFIVYCSIVYVLLYFMVLSEENKKDCLFLSMYLVFYGYMILND